MDETRLLLNMFDDKSKMRLYSGTFVGMDKGRGLVDIDGSRIPVTMAGFIPRVNETVRVIVADGFPLLWGPVGVRSKRGVVGAVGSTYVQVVTDYETLENVLYVGAAPSSGQTVALDWNEDGPFVVGVLSSTPPPPPPPPPEPAPVPTRSTERFSATGSGSATVGKSHWWTNDVYASSSTRGVFVYGRKIRDSLKGATINRIEIRLLARRDGGNAPRVGTQPLESIGGLSPGVSNLWSMPRPVSGWELLFDEKDRPQTQGIADALQAGGGIGFDGAGYTIFQGLQSDREAGALKITYTK